MYNHITAVTGSLCKLGEGPVWDHREKRIFWVDILQGTVHCFYPFMQTHAAYRTGQMVGAVALRRSGGLIAALENGFAVIDLDSGQVQPVVAVEDHLPDNRFNDGKCDPAGRFWAGTMSTAGDLHAGSLYMVDHDFSVTTKISGVGCSNGLAWSPDHRTMYYIDTLTREVMAYDYKLANGYIDNGRTVFSLPEAEGYPDGMTIDTAGMLWIAVWGGWKVIRIDPHTGQRLLEIRLPVSQVSSCVFGGDKLDDLYITSACAGLTGDRLTSQPLSGAVFVLPHSGFTGSPAFLFGG